jgi:hypothetical protein
MPRAPRDKENATPTPKKRTRKVAEPTNGNGMHAGAENGNGAVETSVTAPEVTPATEVAPNLEEQIRLRAYHLYLQRGGNGGSPEQDWLRAKEEIAREHSVA